VRDKIVGHALKVDRVLRITRDEIKEEFANRIYTKKGYALFKSNKKRFLVELQNEMLKRELSKHTGELMTISRTYKNEMVK